MSPMPYSIFFAGGYAIHGTYSTASLGRPASHGCIRLAPGNAARLFHMVQTEGAEITISGTPPRMSYYARVHRKKHATAYARSPPEAGLLRRLAPETPQCARLRAGEACASRSPDLASQSRRQVVAAMANMAVGDTHQIGSRIKARRRGHPRSRLAQMRGEVARKRRLFVSMK